MRVVLLGPPGAGKGTVAVRLADRYGIAHIATGDLLRSQVRAGTPLGKKAKALLDAGKLVPDDLVVDMVAARLKDRDTKNGFLLDGFPRTVPQGEALKNVLSQLDQSLSGVIYFDTADDVIISRLSGRRSCPNCGMTFHIKNIPPRKEGVCDRCGAGLTQRSDDAPETVRERLAVYQKQTEPLVRFYKTEGLLHRTSGDMPRDEQIEKLKQLFVTFAA